MSVYLLEYSYHTPDTDQWEGAVIGIFSSPEKAMEYAKEIPSELWESHLDVDYEAAVPDIPWKRVVVYHAWIWKHEIDEPLAYEAVRHENH